MPKPPLPSQLNVCLIAKNYPIAGRATGFSFLRLIARKLVEKGHQVTVLTRQQAIQPTTAQGRVSDMVQDGVKIFFLADVRKTRGRGDSFAELIKTKFVELHRREPFHLIHSVDNSAIRISTYKDAYRVAVAYDVAATSLSQVFAITAMGQETVGSLLRTNLAVVYMLFRSYLGGDRRLLRSADGVFVTSPRERTALERYYLYPDVRIHTVPYGIEVGDLSPRERSDELRNSLQIPPSAKTVVTVTDMTEIGEVANLLAAFEQVVIKKPSSRLIIVGDGPKYKQIEYAMLNLALGSKVVFTGAVRETEIPDYIALADVYVNLSSRVTGFEPSLLEAMAQKKVIIGSEVSPMASIVEHARDGFLIRPADIEELTVLINDAFSGVIRGDLVGEAARNKVLDLFDGEKMMIETLNSYYAILKKSGFYRRSITIAGRLRELFFTYN